MRSLHALFALALLSTAPLALAGDPTIPQPGSHFISVRGDAVAAGAAALKGDTLWYTYELPPIPRIQCRGEVVLSYYLKDVATGATHSPIVKQFGTSVGFRSDGPTNGFLATSLGGGALATVELWVNVKCTDPGGASVDRLVASIGVTP